MKKIWRNKNAHVNIINTTETTTADNQILSYVFYEHL